MQIVDIREIVAPQNKNGTNLFTFKDNEIECFEGLIILPSTTMTGPSNFEGQFYDIRRPYQTSYSSYNEESKKRVDSFILNNVYLTLKNDNDIKELRLPQAYEEELFSCLNNNQRAVSHAYTTLSANDYYSGLLLTGVTTSFEKLIISCKFASAIVHYQISDIVLSSCLNDIQSDLFKSNLLTREKDGKRIVTINSYSLSSLQTKEMISLAKFIFNSSFCEVL